jgi:hypothetical protein
LKPSLSSPPTEVRVRSTRPRISALTSYLPCENDQAKPDRLSRLARSTLLSKILLAFRLSGAAWIEAPDCDVGVVLELIALCQFHALQRLWAFLREPSKPIEVPMSCQATIRWESRP